MKKLSLTIAIICLVGVAFGQGSLTPPSAPGATMKTLTELDTAISDVNTATSQIQDEARIDLATVAGGGGYHHMITEPGSYYLRENLETTLSGGILIAVSNVTLDLNGYSIIYSSGVGQYGIGILSEADGSTIKNGIVKGFWNGVSSAENPRPPRGGSYENLTVSACSSAGIEAGTSSKIRNCSSFGNSGTAAIQAKEGSLISDCTVYNNTTAYGIYADYGSSISQCAAYGNQTKYGIFAYNGSTISHCTSAKNEGTGSESYGIYAGGGSTIIACASRNNTNTNSPSTASQGAGIRSGACSIKDSTASANPGDGICVSSDSFVTGNTCDSNGYNGDGAGIRVTGYDNRIDGNNVTDNDRGIDVDVSGNLIVRNSASGNTTDYDIDAGNDTGTIQTSPVGAGAWDNFEF